MTRETEGARGFREGCALWRTGWGAATERYGHGECGWGARTASLLNAVVQFEDKWRGETTTRARGGEMKARICLISWRLASFDGWRREEHTL